MATAKLHLYLIHANGQWDPYYHCTEAPTLDGKPLWSGDWRNEFQLPDLQQTDLAIDYTPQGGTIQKPSVISPIMGGYTLDEATTFSVNTSTDFHQTNKDKLSVPVNKLKVCAPDSVLGKDLRQTELQGNFWTFKVLCEDASEMELLAHFTDGDRVCTAPPDGELDENAPEVGVF